MAKLHSSIAAVPNTVTSKNIATAIKSWPAAVLSLRGRSTDGRRTDRRRQPTHNWPLRRVGIKDHDDDDAKTVCRQLLPVRCNYQDVLRETTHEARNWQTDDLR